jgi:hypothetical protein
MVSKTIRIRNNYSNVDGIEDYSNSRLFVDIPIFKELGCRRRLYKIGNSASDLLQKDALLNTKIKFVREH